MDRSLGFRRALLDRILFVATGTALTSIAAHAVGCSGHVTIDADDEVTGAGGATGSTSSSVAATSIAATSAEAVTATSVSSSSSSGQGGHGGSPTSGCVPTEPDTQWACFEIERGAGCPPVEEALRYFEWSWCATSVVCGDPGNDFPHAQCCYVITTQPCAGGRPLWIDGELRVARGDGCASGWREPGVRPDVRGLTRAELEVLSSRWTRDALLEHASVASFARFALELLAVGAPGELVEAAHAAALDEIGHARLCFALASAYGADAAPSALSLPGRLELATDLAGAARAAVRDGCIGETLAAVVAAEQLAAAKDPAARRVLSTIAAEEARHAELAWRFVAWALAQGDARVRAEISRAFEEATIGPLNADGPEATPALRAHGYLDAAVLRGTIAHAMKEVVRPGARALLGSAQRRARRELPVASAPGLDRAERV